MHYSNMNYSKMSIAQLEAKCAELYQGETLIHEERTKAVAVLRLKMKRRDAAEKILGAEAVVDAVNEELSEPSWFDRLKEKVGL